MESTREMRAMDIFSSFLEEEPAHPEEFLREACKDDTILRDEVLRYWLLHQQAERNEFLSIQPTFTAKTIVADPIIGQVVARYCVKAMLGEGAMGRVYLAEQINPRRNVALKLIHPHVMSETIRKRFEHEAHILGRLHHYGIAQIFEAGMAETANGSQPYFAMELIEGARSITQSVTDRALSLSDRLSLFCSVCDAVHHGHQKGIIHRDLKPDNVLVGQNGQPKIVDFGVARVNDLESRTSRQTHQGQLVGTLQYMSPEQCDCDMEDVDARCDVYALGVLLYELICNRLPYEVGRLPLIEAARMIREVTPVRPSAWNRRLKGDLETIVLKALEKERDRRYRSASELGNDIQRYLDKQPIIARPASATYQIQKLVRRHRALTASILGILLLLVTATVVVAIMAAQIAGERDRAVTARNTAAATSRFLQQMLASGDPTIERRDVKVADVLDAAARQANEFEGDPEPHASICTTLGTSYKNLGIYDAALLQFQTAVDIRRQAIGDDALETLESLMDITEVRRLQGDFAAAELELTPILSVLRLRSEDARPQLGRCLAIYAKIQLDKGSYTAAEAAFDEALAILGAVYGEDHVDVGTTLVHLVTTLWRQGKVSEAATTNERALQILLKRTPPDSPDVLSCRTVQGFLLSSRGRYDDAETQYLKVIEASRLRFGNVHEHISTSWMNIAQMRFRKEDRLGESEALREALAIETEIRPNHPRRGNLLRRLGESLIAQRRFMEAEQVLLKAIDEFAHEEIAPSEYLTPATIPLALGECFTELGRFEEAELMLHRSEKLLRSYANHHPEGAVLKDIENTQDDLRECATTLYEKWGRQP